MSRSMYAKAYIPKGRYRENYKNKIYRLMEFSNEM